MKWLIEETLLITLGIIAIIAAIIVGGSYWWYSSNTQPVSDDTTQQEFIIQQGESFGEVAERLESNKLIRNAFTFRVWAKLSGDEITVQAGKHMFSPSMTYEQIIDQMSVGIKDVTIRVPEGVRVEEIDELFKLSLEGEYNSDEFLKKAKSLEGMLFPDTYSFHKNSSVDTVVGKLNGEFEAKYTELKGPTDPTQKKKVIIVASLLEREGRNDKDRSIIAGIFENRLKTPNETAGLLQVDATLQYVIGRDTKTNTWWRSPTPDDKETDSPYNTYKNHGYPPSPICNPSASSLKAAITPEKSNYLYYIHDNKGTAYYAKTLDEHNRNIAKYLQ
jgi:UPF0755 protein